MLCSISQNKKIIKLGILIKIFLDLSFYFPLQRFFSLKEFSIDFSFYKLIISYFYILILLMLIPNKEKSIRFIITIPIIFIFIPLSTVFSMQNENMLYFNLCFFTYLLVELFVKLRFPYLSLNLNINQIIEWCLISITIVTISWMIWTEGLPKLDALNFLKIYDFRDTVSINKYLVYLINIQSVIISPFFISISIYKKNINIGIVYIAIQVLLFLWTGNKGWIFLLILQIYFVYFLKNKSVETFLKPIGFLVFGLLILCISPLCTIKFIQILFSLVFRRTFIEPAVLRYAYFDFFQSNRTIGLWGTIFAPLMSGSSAYSSVGSYTYMISSRYMSYISNANTGMYGGELAHFGISGIFVAMLSFFVFLVVLKVFCIHKSSHFIIGVSLFLVLNLTNKSAFSMFFGFEGILLILILIFYNVEDKSSFAI